MSVNEQGVKLFPHNFEMNESIELPSQNSSIFLAYVNDLFFFRYKAGFGSYTDNGLCPVAYFLHDPNELDE